ncbi:tRNA (cytidine(34)-2'-O)-methyltransferase [Salinisphaera sp. Q1T1-3]|uniref:tRNA (cytidine(34)-2'-O)-methyltransferase n=1 Tax=Salinisphaera sp. Q1T1-3 TaxID=2321229 RepID=UPI000E733EBF|nr:tRNA (cytidine(34)-2'-O)-methyltransferase [Salinisphaera sp. Q1T1-3]RJS91588.1 tRNA (cytidine(34)-2'-O)-methyltransferase [Salinisphaera sp. Q1T1-3]
MHIVLHEPEIPPNTGNAIRLAANIGATLHLIHPLGFSIDDRRLRRAGLDYREIAVIREWADYDSWRAAHPDNRVFAATKHGDVRYDTVAYQADDALLFGCETRGLPAARVRAADAAIHLPMRPGNRSLNLSNSVAVVAYEAWRQRGFV